MLFNSCNEGNGSMSESIRKDSQVDRDLEQECNDMETELNNQVQTDCTSKIVDYPSMSEGDKE